MIEMCDLWGIKLKLNKELRRGDTRRAEIKVKAVISNLNPKARNTCDLSPSQLPVTFLC